MMATRKNAMLEVVGTHHAKLEKKPVQSHEGRKVGNQKGKRVEGSCSCSLQRERKRVRGGAKKGYPSWRSKQLGGAKSCWGKVRVLGWEKKKNYGRQPRRGRNYSEIKVRRRHNVARGTGARTGVSVGGTAFGDKHPGGEDGAGGRVGEKKATSKQSRKQKKGLGGRILNIRQKSALHEIKKPASD